MRKNLSKLLAVFLSIIMTTALFAGCKKTEEKPSAGDGTEKEQLMVYNLGAEPETIDPALNTAVDGGIVIINCFEGLVRLDDKGQPAPGVAERWDISEDQLTYTFHLRKDAKFSDGTPITAKDFEYSWKRVVNPATEAEYVTQLLMVKNAEEISNGKMDIDQLGIKVVDDYTFEVYLKALTPYFLELCAFPTLLPVKKDVVEKDPDTWATKPETYIGNGPFKIESWTNNDHMMLVRNENYWDAKNVKLDKLKFVVVVEESSALTAWEKKDIDINDKIPTAELQKLVSEGKAKILPELGVSYVNFNVTRKPLDDVRVREALALAINKKQICENVLRGGEVPANGVVPYGVNDAKPGSDFRAVAGNELPPEGDIQKAKQLLAEAGYPDGKGFPELTYCYNTSETNKAVAEAIQNMWKQNLNINVKLENLEWGVFIPKRQNGDYDIARGAWLGDYMDPMTFLDLFTSQSGNNDPQYRIPAYDDLISKARMEGDAEKRWQYLHEAENMLLKDVPIAVVNFRANPMSVHPYCKDVFFSALGFIDFDRAYVDYSIKDGK